MNTIPIQFYWLTCETDPRPYKPGKPVLEPINIIVEVDLPLENIYVKNYERISIAQMQNEAVPMPVLTPLGMKYCIDQLETAMSPHNLSAETEKVDWEGDGNEWKNS